MRVRCLRHQIVDARDRLVERARGDEAEHPRDLDAVIDLVRVAGSGMPNRVKPAGAGSVCHIASIAASFIFWFSETV